MIIALAGDTGSGKDTVGAYLIKEHGFERKAFADPLKRAIAALFDIPFSEIDKLKNDTTIMVGFGRQDDISMDIVPIHRPITFRKFVQNYGESLKLILGDDVWTNLTLPKASYAGRKIVITDCRFIVEAERIKQFDGMIWEIVRPSVQKPAQESANKHVSDIIDFDTDYVIHNDSTLEELYKRVEVALSVG